MHCVSDDGIADCGDEQGTATPMNDATDPMMLIVAVDQPDPPHVPDQPKYRRPTPIFELHRQLPLIP
jgi:hypothetical protein